MEAVSDSKESVLRAKLEFGVMRSAFERAHLAWTNARSELKPAMLLSGQTLSRAEGWLHDFPEKLSDSEKSFIMASIAKNSMDRQRDGTIIEQVIAKSSNGTFWLVVVTFFLIVRLFIPMAVEQLTGVPVKTEDKDAPLVAERPVLDRDGSERAGDAVTRDRPMFDPDADVDAEPDPRPLAPAEQKRLAKLEAQRVLRQYTAATRSSIDRGDTRTALLLAVEAVQRSASIGAEIAPEALRAAGTMITEALTRRIADGPVPATAVKGPAAMFCGEGSAVVTAGANGTIRLLGRNGAGLRGEIAGHERLLRGGSIDERCEALVLAGEDHTAEIWSLATGRRLAVLSGHEGDIPASAFSPDGRLIATAGQESVVRLWDARTGRPRAVLEGHEWAVNTVAFSPDGALLVSGGADKTARVWRVGEARSTMVLAGHAGGVTQASFSPDGKQLLTVGLDGHAIVWDSATGQQLRRLKQAQTAIMSAKFSPDGGSIAGVTQHGGVVIWAGAGDPIVFERATIDENVRDVAFSPDGRQLLTTSWRGDAALWNATTGRLLFPVGHVAGKVEAATIVDGGKRALALLKEGALVTWPLLGAPSSLIAHAKAVAGPCLSTEERSALGLDEEKPDWCSGAGAAPRQN